MNLARRPQLTQRRRRVIYSQQAGADDALAGASRVAQLRAARRPTAAYGSRVHRRLRARWFGLVPVRRRAMGVLGAAVAVVTGLLIAGHWLALTWPALAYQPGLAGPLRLDRPDGLGTWLGTMLLAASSVTALLIYQLRRHRADDYKGHYRLWRPTIVLLLIASVDSVVGLIDWSGAMLDATLGRRAALAGGDWVRLLLAVGGVSFGLRMIVEVRRSPTAVIALAVALAAFAFPAAVRWRIISVQSPLGWTLLAAAPLIGRSSVWVALVAYLRVLYREVRRIEQEASWCDRLRQWRQRIAAEARERRTPATAPPSKTRPATAATRRSSRPIAGDAPDADDATATSGEQATPRKAMSGEQATADGSAQRDKPRRRLWPFGRSRAAQADQDTDEEPKPMKQRTAEKRAAQAEQESRKAAPASSLSGADQPARPVGKQRRRLWPWFKRGNVDQTSAAADRAAHPGESASKKPMPPLAADSIHKAPAETSGKKAAADPPADGVAPSEGAGSSRRGLRLPAWLRFGRSSAVAAEEGADVAARENGGAAVKRDDAAVKRSVPPERPSQGPSAPQPSASAVAAAGRADHRPQDDGDHDDDADGDDEGSTDWSSMSKAERRRLKRQQKRDGRAA